MARMRFRLTDDELDLKLKRLRDLKIAQGLVADEIELINNQFKQHLDAIGADELSQFGYVISNKEIETTTLDAKALREALPDVAERFSRTRRGRRFMVRAVA